MAPDPEVHAVVALLMHLCCNVLYARGMAPTPCAAQHARNLLCLQQARHALIGSLTKAKKACLGRHKAPGEAQQPWRQGHHSSEQEAYCSSCVVRYQEGEGGGGGATG